MDNSISPTVRKRTPFLSRDQRIMILAPHRAGISNRPIQEEQLLDVLGGFAGVERGPCIFWKRDWGNVTSEKYALPILPSVVDWTRAKSEEIGRQVYSMHENAAVQKGRPAREYLYANGVESIPWPANSPDINPIENVWSMMKYYIQERYPELEQRRQRNRKEVRSIVLEAWYHSTTVEKLSRLMESMSRRCEEVVGANGGPISF
ncbi:hypothetical protein K3495_g13354 [Podosphaera aphanis]|nr:hypothetical protein K3495_g13354 [Podosphaera aphanis]